MFGCEHSGVRPDIITIGKALGGGYPVTGLITTEAICAASPWSKPSFSSSSYGGNPLAAAAAHAAVASVAEDDLPGNARRVGAEMLAAMRPLGGQVPLCRRRTRPRPHARPRSWCATPRPWSPWGPPPAAAFFRQP